MNKWIGLNFLTIMKAGGVAVDRQQVSQWTSMVLAECARISYVDGDATDTLDLVFPYIATTVKQQVKGSVTLARHFCGAVIKTFAAMNDSMKRLSVDAEVRQSLSFDVHWIPRVILPDVLEDYNMGRSAANHLIDNCQAEAPQDFAKALLAGSLKWKQYDAIVGLDCALLQHLAETEGGSCLIAQAEDSLPDGVSKVSMGKSLSRLRLLKESSRTWFFGSAGSRGVVETLIEVIADMELGASPSNALFPPGSTMGKLGKRMMNFLYHEVMLKCQSLMTT